MTTNTISDSGLKVLRENVRNILLGGPTFWSAGDMYLICHGVEMVATAGSPVCEEFYEYKQALAELVTNGQPVHP